MTIRFVIDERSIDLNDLAEEVRVDTIESFLECIADAQGAGHGVCYDEALFSDPLLGDRNFWQLFDEESPVLPRDVRELASAIFGRMPRLDEVDAPWPEDVEVCIGGGDNETTLSVAWAHRQAVHGGLRSVACICASGRRRTGAVAVEVAGRSEEVCFVANAYDIENYFRWLIARYAITPDDIASLAAFAFTQLSFVPKCFDGIGKMSRPCRHLARDIVQHLSAFSDAGRKIFSDPWIMAPAKFGSLGVEISDENGNTKNNSQARRERLIVFEDEELFFWWHSKIERHQDRIHICPDRVARGGKIVVGIFCKHLTV